MENAQHKAKQGEILPIKNVTAGGKPCVEGKAKLLKLKRRGEGLDPDLWDVEFTDEPGQTYQRYIYF